MPESKASGAPFLVRRFEAKTVLWGDDESGYINDLVYVRGSELLAIMVCLPPGGMFGGSERVKPIYDADECFYVLEGQLTVHNPENGEVCVAETGEMIFVRGPFWLYGGNLGGGELRFLETIAPPIEAGKFDHLPIPAAIVQGNVDALKDYPRSRPKNPRMDVVGKSGALNLVLGRTNKVLFRVFASNNRISMGSVALEPGRRTDPLCWTHETVVFGLSGFTHVRVQEDGFWAEVGPDDAVYLPAGKTWQLFNHRGEPASALVSVAGCLADELVPLTVTQPGASAG